MKNCCTIVFISLSVILTPAKCLSQGCSDAGFCTMGAMKPDQPFNRNIPLKLRSMEVSFYRGTTVLSPVIYVGTLDMTFNIAGEKNLLQLKLPYQAVEGNLGSTSGLGDLSICVTRQLSTIGNFDLNFSLGAKIPSNKSDLRNDSHDLPLPMYYQTSLGTYDLVAGGSMISRSWLFAAGIQHPFNKNENTFTWAPWIPVYLNGEGADYIRSYDGAYKLKRGTDVMLRIERNFRFSRINCSVGALPIYRITRDEVTAVSTGKRLRPDGTTGLALSAIATAGYSFNIRTGIKILYGKKILQRDLNPDGLTRHDVTTVSYYYRF